MARFKSTSTNAWIYPSDNTYNYDSTNTPLTIGSIGASNSTTVGTGGLFKRCTSGHASSSVTGVAAIATERDASSALAT